MKKIIFINPIAEQENGSHSAIFPLQMGIIAALIPVDFDIEIFDENLAKFTYRDCDIVAITCRTKNINRAYEIALMYKEKKIPVVLGGIHASFCPDEALKYVDAVVIGEAEPVLEKVLDDFKNHQLKSIYKADDYFDLKKNIIPRRDLFGKRYGIPTIQTARGCPMDCDYCSVPLFNGKKIRRRPIDNVLAELERIPRKMLYFVDDDMVGYDKDSEQKFIDLCKGMVNRRIKKKWFCNGSIKMGMNEEVLKWAKKSGCVMVYVGIESNIKDQLEEVNKKINSRYDYGKVFKNFHKHHLPVSASVIFGFENETKETMREKANYLIHSDIDAFHLSVLSPSPCTKLFQRMQKEKRLLYTNFPKDWVLYDDYHLLFELKNMTSEVFYKELFLNTKRIFSIRNIWIKFIKSLWFTKSIYSSLTALVSNFEHRRDWYLRAKNRYK